MGAIMRRCAQTPFIPCVCDVPHSRHSPVARSLHTHTQAQGSELGARHIQIVTGRDLNAQAAQAVADESLAIDAGRDLNVLSERTEQHEERFHEKKASGVFASGGGVTLGQQQRSTESRAQASGAAASTFGVIDGDVHLNAARHYTQRGGDVLAPGVAYEKITASADYGLANFLGYTNAAELYAALQKSRGDTPSVSLGHSRGTLVQEAAFTILANRHDADGSTYKNPNLVVRGVGGAADAEAYTDKAAQIVGDSELRKQITYSYFSNDPVSTSFVSGGNTGTWSLSDLLEVFNTNNSMHSCYGTGAPGCKQVEIPMPGGHEGTPEGNAKLIKFEGGKRVNPQGAPNVKGETP